MTDLSARSFVFSVNILNKNKIYNTIKYETILMMNIVHSIIKGDNVWGKQKIN